MWNGRLLLATMNRIKMCIQIDWNWYIYTCELIDFGVDTINNNGKSKKLFFSQYNSFAVIVNK